MEITIPKLINILNCIIGIFMIIFGFFGILSLNIFDYVFLVYFMLFGFLIVASIFEWAIIKNNFLILKTIKGKGFFNLFIASFALFNGALINYIVAAALAILGAAMLVLGFKFDIALDDDVKHGDVLGAAQSKLGGKVALNIGLKAAQSQV